jgi:two-component system, chemotaxis family, protein-glutamate methylesterase/glutaminase
MLLAPSINTNVVRAVVTDDTALYRRTIADILKSIPDVEVIGSAYDGEDCLDLVQRIQPDLITLDIQMPRRDGLSTLEELKRRKNPSEVVMVCSETVESADQTMKALRMGALDMILKPSGKDMAENRRSLESQLKQHVQTVRFRRLRRPTVDTSAVASRSIRAESSSTNNSNRPLSSSGKPRCVCIGVSTGGPQALGVLVGGLPANFPVPIFIVQHMPPVFTKSLADHLSKAGRLTATEAVDGETALPGRIYIAPGGKQMRVENKGTSFVIQVTNDPPVGACKPSVDYLFESVNMCAGKDAVGVILTGMGNDGLAGCRRLHACGATIIAQSAETCVVYGMPRQVVENNLAHEILPLDQIAKRITQLTQSLASCR